MQKACPLKRILIIKFINSIQFISIYIFLKKLECRKKLYTFGYIYLVCKYVYDSKHREIIIIRVISKITNW